MWPGCVERQTNGTDMIQPPSGTKSKLPRSTFSVLWYWVDLKSDLLLSWAPRPNTAGAKPARLNGRVHEAQTIGPKPASSLPAGELSPISQQTHTGPFQDLLRTSSHRVHSSMYGISYPETTPISRPGLQGPVSLIHSYATLANAQVFLRVPVSRTTLHGVSEITMERPSL